MASWLINYSVGGDSDNGRNGWTTKEAKSYEEAYRKTQDGNENVKILSIELCCCDSDASSEGEGEER